MIVDTDDVLSLFGASDKDIYAMGTIEDAIYDGTLKPAETDRKTGRWIYEERKRLVNETDDGPVYRTEKWWLCSECGYAKGYQISKPSSNYCENCGAEMRKEGEG